VLAAPRRVGMPTIAAGDRKLDDAGGHGGIKAQPGKTGKCRYGLGLDREQGYRSLEMSFEPKESPENDPWSD
jgi:hypothetical protein